MSKIFRYVQNDDVVKTFNNLKGTVLAKRPVVIARHGDYSLLLEAADENILKISIVNDEKKKIYSERTFDITETSNELVSRGVRHATQKLSELCDAEVNKRRFQIWKWYMIDWQKEHAKETEEFIDHEIAWNEDEVGNETEVMDIESFLHGEYLNLGNTLSLIERYVVDENHKEMFKKFAIADIMEMTTEDTKEKSIEETEKRLQNDELKRHSYRFTVCVEATDKEHARQALLNHLAGDERITVQK